MQLISLSLAELDAVLDHSRKHYGGDIDHVYVPRLGCGNGNLDWKTQVEPLVAKWLRNDSRYTIVTSREDDDEDRRKSNVRDSTTRRR